MFAGKDPKRKVTSRAAETQVKKLKKSLKNSPLYSSITSEADNTLPDDIFLDSFDKFRFNEHQELRTKKVLKKDIRASFNRDSSIENSWDESEASYSMSESVHGGHEAENDDSDPIEDENLSTTNAHMAVMEGNDSLDCNPVHQIHQDELVSAEFNEDGESREILSSSSSCVLSPTHKSIVDSLTPITSFVTKSKLSIKPKGVVFNEMLSSPSWAAVQSPIHATIVTSSTPMSLAHRPKLSVKPRGVVFDVEDSVHELSRESEHNGSRVQLKGGKWRRTIFEIKKHKVTQSPRRTLEKINEMKSRRSTQHQYHGITLRRKSIYIKDIPDRRTIYSLGHRQSHHNVTVPNDSDHSAAVASSPRHKWVNTRPRLRCTSLPPISDDSNRTDESSNLAAIQVSLSDSSCIESIADDFERSDLEIGTNRDQLKGNLLKRCGQTDVLPFGEVYSASVLTKCRKIGEGVFGEVFLNENASRSSYVLKIIPIESDLEVNGAVQKRFDEMLQEVIISQELSALRHGDENRSAGFVEVLNARLVIGRYPDHLLELWHEYDARRNSENDCPDVFGDDQLYVVFELANAGTDLEAYCFKNAEQSYSTFKQVALSLAVAESEFEFEHRDLHWGNVLVAPTTEATLTFTLNGKSVNVRTHGIKATIIDYTLSRLVYKNCCLFQDLANDPELFEASGDYQFDVYRLMKTHTNNVWEVFEPFTNVLWLHYTVDKMVNGVRYSATKSIKHRQVTNQMKKVRDCLLEYTSATAYTEADFAQ